MFIWLLFMGFNLMLLFIMCRNIVEIYGYFSIYVFVGGVILNGEGIVVDI